MSKKYVITDLNIERIMDAQQYTTFNGCENAPGGVCHKINMSIEILDGSAPTSLEDMEDFLSGSSGSQKIHERAPSYLDYIRKYNPEFLF